MTAVETDRAHIAQAQAPPLPIDTPPIDAGIHPRIKGTLLDQSTEVVDPKYVKQLGEDGVAQVLDEHRGFMDSAKIKTYGQIFLERSLRAASRQAQDASAPSPGSDVRSLFRRNDPSIR